MLALLSPTALYTLQLSGGPASYVHFWKVVCVFLFYMGDCLEAAC